METEALCPVGEEEGEGWKRQAEAGVEAQGTGAPAAAVAAVRGEEERDGTEKTFLGLACCF